MKSFLTALVTLAAALVASGLLVRAMGESPWHVFRILLVSSFGSPSALGYTFFYATPLILTGLSVALAFHAGLFNVGCEGQLYIGAFAATLVGLFAPVGNEPSVFWILLATLAAFVGGALWGLLPGLLKAYRGSHEVIVTIMLNAVAIALSSYLTLYVFRDLKSQSIETPTIMASAIVPSLSKISPLPEGSPANFTFFLALAMAAATYVFLWKTKQGFSLRATGESNSAARCAGIPVRGYIVWAMVLAGGLAGLVGANDILGYVHRFKEGFSPGYGFLGIAVALLGRNHPLGIVIAAILFGALQNGSIALDLDTEHLSRDLITVLQGVIILAAASDGYFRRVFNRLGMRMS